MSNKISLRAQNTPASPIRSLAAIAQQTQSKGIHIHKLNIGQPDVESPHEFIDGIRNFSDKVVAYDASNGNSGLITQWTELLNKQYGINISSKELLITSGSSEALTFAFTVCCDVNDEILAFEPTYANYTGFASMTGVTLVPVECSFNTGFHLPDKEVILKHITPKTKAIILCNPNNPTGTVYGDDELKVLIQICEEKDLFLIVDEVYREFVYDGRTPRCIYEIAPKHEKIVVIDSVSKRYSLCGARVGCLITTNKNVMTAVSNLASTRVSSATIEQRAAEYMLSCISDSYLIDSISEYKKRRDVICNQLQQIEGIKLNVSEGGFYAFVQLPVNDAEDFAKFLLKDFSVNNETVFLAPGNGFYIKDGIGKNTVRIAFVLSTHELEKAIKIIELALVVYQSKPHNP